MSLLPQERAEEWDPALAQEVISGLSENILATTDTDRKDRLWPADAMVFQTNPLNLAYGACGTALFLSKAVGELPDAVESWLQESKVTVESYPPGLYSGMAGVAWTFLEMGLTERAIELMDLVPESPLAFKGADLFNGTAGWGLAALATYKKTGEERFLESALRAGEFLEEAAEHDEVGAFWRDEGSEPETPRFLGIAYGSSGVAFFLLQLWKETGTDALLHLAHEALRFELSFAKERDDGLVWGVSDEDEGDRPYWLRGGAGIASVLIRFASLLGDEEYEQVARRAAVPCMSFFSAAPHAFEGLAAMGETLLDLYTVTGEARYLEKARQKAFQCMLYRIERPEGLAFPGRFDLRISHDLGVGGAGIGLFLLRALDPGPRLFHDLDLDVLPSAAEQGKPAS